MGKTLNICISLELAPPPKQQIACTRSFGRPVKDLAPLVEAVSHFAPRAAEKLRAHGAVLVFAHSSPFRANDPRCSESTSVLVAAAERGMRKIYQPGYRLAKAGVMLLELSPQTRDQPSLLPEEAELTGRDHSALMEAMDRINQRWGKGAVAVGSAVQVGAWGEARAPHRHVHHPAGSGAGGAVRWMLCPSLYPGLKRLINLIDPPAAIDPEQPFRTTIKAAFRGEVSLSLPPASLRRAN